MYKFSRMLPRGKWGKTAGKNRGSKLTCSLELVFLSYLHLYIILRMTCWLKYQYNLCFGIELFNIEEKVISLH